MSTRNFSLGAILSITDGHLVAPNHMDDVYDIVGYLIADRGITTIGLLAVREPCKAALLEQHPQLVGVEMRDDEDWRAWIAAQVERFGAELPVSPIAHPPTPRTIADDILDVMRINPKADVMVIEP